MKYKIYHKIFLVFISLVSVKADAQDIEFARKVIDTLTAPGMHGRGYALNGDKIAAAYIADQFKNFNLQHYQQDYYQDFKMAINTFPAAMELKINNQTIIPGKDYLIKPCSPGIKGDYKAIYLSEEELLDERKIKYRLEDYPSVALIADLEGFTVKDKKEQALQALNVINNSANDGTIILLLTNEKLTWTKSQVECGIPFFIVDKSVVKEKVANVYVHVDNRYHSGYTTQNVIGYIEGSSKPDSMIAITAHYDHLGRMGIETYFPGANDNASGVAMLLNLAKHFSAPENQPEFTIVFIAFSGEEAGLLGSRYFVNNPYFELDNIKFLLNLDLAGTGGEGITVVNGKIYEEKFELLTNINRQYTLLVEVKSRGEACNSDHCFFHLAQVPSFFIYTLGGIQAYHDIYDRAETLPLTEYRDYFKLLQLFIEKIMNP